ncbi:MAG: uroporphyrinogen decarboxylase family protein [Armatimonadota bacterium]
MNNEQEQKIDWLLNETQKNNGLAPVDLDKFWEDDTIASKNPFGEDIPQVPLGIRMSGECVFDELGVKEDYWKYDHDEEWRLELNKRYNDISKKIVGKRLLNETPSDPTKHWPPIKTLPEIFEAENVWIPGTWSWWLQESAHNEDELQALLDRVDRRLENLKEFILPPNWEEEKERLLALGCHHPRFRGLRGPVTFATSIYGAERLIFLIYDNPKLAERFRDAILRSIIGIAEVLDESAGDTPPHGFGFADDNCYLLTKDMYEFFGYPILKTIFDKYSPNPGDSRFQHSDSAMSHLLPLFGQLKMTAVNFGPTVMVDEIRKHIPNAVIHGQLAPFTLSRNDERGIVAEFLRDFEMAKEKRGLLFSTAGSINNGSRLTGMRLIMSAIQNFGRYNN